VGRILNRCPLPLRTLEIVIKKSSGANMAAVARGLGLTHGRVTQIYQDAIKKLRAAA
jgi:DNA-directed RNA polymerase sigma subunit (sigma70/sigma32)